jgi:hypothetical protein
MNGIVIILVKSVMNYEQQTKSIQKNVQLLRLTQCGSSTINGSTIHRGSIHRGSIHRRVDSSQGRSSQGPFIARSNHRKVDSSHQFVTGLIHRRVMLTGNLIET